MSSPIQTGTKLGRYEIRSQLGAGGMGEVYLAEDTELGRTVALKVLPADVAGDKQRMHRFTQEAKTASALNHPNILTIFEIGHVDGTPFIATEYIYGETLRQRMQGTRIKLSEVLNVAIQIADALAAAHEAGIIHRDIKPENIMLRQRDAYVKVLDFGLAKLIEQRPATVDAEAPTKTLFQTAEGMVIGTVIYMSPEQARGLKVDARTDVWSLGVVLYEMVAGCLPFEGSTKSEVLASILNEKEPPPLARFTREVPAELERIVTKALRKDREQRYQGIKDLLLDLKSLKQRLELAVDRDPNFALGYVGLADCYVVLELYAGVPFSETLPRARAAVDRALQLDDSLSEAHTSSAGIYEDQWRWAEAEEEYKRAISLNPNYPTAHHWFSINVRTKRQFDDAMREIKRAQELDPLSPIISANVAEVYILKNDFNSAVEQCKKIIELDPSFSYSRAVLSWAYLKQRRFDEATAESQRAVELSGRASFYLSDLGYCYAVTGRRAEALAILKELEEKYARREAIGLSLAGVYAGLGDKDQAFAWLEKDYQQRGGLLPYITWFFSFEDLRSDPRYADLVRRMGLQP